MLRDCFKHSNTNHCAVKILHIVKKHGEGDIFSTSMFYFCHMENICQRIECPF